jgi:hypothetical protein
MGGLGGRRGQRYLTERFQFRDLRAKSASDDTAEAASSGSVTSSRRSPSAYSAAGGARDLERKLLRQALLQP